MRWDCDGMGRQFTRKKIAPREMIPSGATGLTLLSQVLWSSLKHWRHFIIVLSQFAVTACVRGTGFAFHLEGPEHVK